MLILITNPLMCQNVNYQFYKKNYKKKKKTITTLFLVFAMEFLTCAQNQQATTVDGKNVILKPDGTWNYLEPETKEIENQAYYNDCRYRTNEVDEFTGKKKLVLIEQDFINYTSEELKEYYKKKDYVQCKVYVAKIDETKLAYFYWTLQTKEAYKYFGSIAQDSKIMVKFHDGETIELNFSKSDVGDTKYDYGYTTYRSYVILDEESIKLLKTKKIDKVRMYWSKGYQDYPVSNGNLFIDQLPCID
jgi:hypothetical protein